MAMFNKKKPQKKTVSKKQKPKPQSQVTTLGPVRTAAPKYEPAPFVPYAAPPVQPVASLKKAAAPKPKFDPEKEFLRTFKELTYRCRAWDIWNDFIVMAACSLSNPVDKVHYDEREARYMRIIHKYTDEEQELFPTLFAHVVLALEINPEQDFLGKLYNTLNLQDEGRKQHFTPYSVCDVMARITMDDVVGQVRRDGIVTINDPSCGAGTTLIASANAAREALAKAGLNFQNHILITAQDIDETVALMCYIQLSLLGVAAYVKVGNALTEPMSTGDSSENYWYTPMYFSDVWSMWRIVRKMDTLIQTDTAKGKKKPFRLLVPLERKECCCSLAELYEKVAEKAHFCLTDFSQFDCTKICCTKAVQNEVYQYYKEQGGESNAIAMLWASAGPKADLSGDGYAVEIEDGFVREE